LEHDLEGTGVWDEPATPFDLPPEHSELDELESSAATATADDHHGADDALGLYLKQMGAIPLLDRNQELALAHRLERMRSRYRHAALLNWRTLERVVDVFEQVQAEEKALDPTIDVVNTLNLSREQILARMPYNLRTLQHLLRASREEFQALLRSSTSGHSRLRLSLWRRLRKSVKLAEELSPRIDLLDDWTDELIKLSREINSVVRQLHGVGDRSAADRDRRTRL